MSVHNIRNIPITIDHDSYAIEDGRVFRFCHFTQDLSGSSYLQLFFRTGSQNYFCRFGAASGGDSLFRIFEDSTMTSDGVSVSVIAMNRVESVDSSLVAFHTPTVSATGTALCGQYIPGGTDKKSAGGGATTEHFGYLLDTSSTYYLTIENLTSNTITAQIYSEIEVY